MTRHLAARIFISILALLNLGYLWIEFPAALRDRNAVNEAESSHNHGLDQRSNIPVQVTVPPPPESIPVTISTAIPEATDEPQSQLEPLEGIDKIFVITLKNRPDRRAHMERMISFHNLDVEWWPAETPDSYMVKMYLDSIRINDGLRNHTKHSLIMSCYASHVSVYMEIIRRGYKNVLILEDDVDIDLEFRKMWTRRYKAMRNQAWDLLLLGYCTAMKKPLLNGWGLPHWIACTHSYVISHDFAKNFLSTNEHAHKPIDLELADFCFGMNCNVYMTDQLLIAQLPRDPTRNPSSLQDNAVIPGHLVQHSTARLFNETNYLFDVYDKKDDIK